MHKGIAAVHRHPTNRTPEEFRFYWEHVHGPLGRNMSGLRRYVQHICLPEADELALAPNFDGLSMFWTDEVGIAASEAPTPEAVALQQAVRRDDVQLFDRDERWPAHHQVAVVWADEHVVIEGTTSPEMVKLVLIVAKLPGLSSKQFVSHWQREHAELVARVPGLRRYVQNPAVPEAYLLGNLTHDGFAELWFDELGALEEALAAPEWGAVMRDAATLFGPNAGIIVAREVVQKDLDWTYDDFGVGSLDEVEVRARLRADGYPSLAEDPDAAPKIKIAAANGALALFTRHHLVTIDASRIDARPDVPLR